MDSDRVPYGFDDDEAITRLLRSAPPMQALTWVQQVMGGTVESIEARRGGLSSAMHLLRVRCGEQSRSVVLRRYVRPDPQAGQRILVEREAASLEFVESMGRRNHAFLALDSAGRQVGSPALLMTALSGRVEWVPEDVDPWLARMAEVLPAIHKAAPPAVGQFP